MHGSATESVVGSNSLQDAIQTASCTKASGVRDPGFTGSELQALAGAQALDGVAYRAEEQRRGEGQHARWQRRGVS